jgi:hypothetical protein
MAALLQENASFLPLPVIKFWSILSIFGRISGTS